MKIDETENYFLKNPQWNQLGGKFQQVFKWTDEKQ